MKYGKCLGSACFVLCLMADFTANAQPVAENTAAISNTGSADRKLVKKSDRALERQVRRALSKAQGINPSNVYVRARSGAVTLSGTVRNSDQIARVEQIAANVPGVASVSNRLSLFSHGHG
ncbi:BON domain-containing protein [Paraburkholderia sediminicola]|uniref:BON domain-containing protein n=1 Tax=Paraburkholderia sediminicola TaxID=458836 RepID=UPI0038BD1B5D